MLKRIGRDICFSPLCGHFTFYDRQRQMPTGSPCDGQATVERGAGACRLSRRTIRLVSAGSPFATSPGKPLIGWLLGGCATGRGNRRCRRVVPAVDLVQGAALAL